MEQEVQNVETETTATENVENNSAEVVKTFTQDEVNAIVKERLAKAQKGIPSKEELTKYNEWKESQKTQQDKYDELVKNDAEKDSTISTLKKENLVLKSGITDNDEIEFIVYKVSKMDGDFEDNLKQYLANNSKFTKKQEIKATGVESKNGFVAKDDGVMAILKAKHPEIEFD
ncbi:MAG: hypothetical protein VZR33_05590 [Methanosphaera sp.]|nr:hypothetical protein [Methanosphaera sp.]